MNDGTVSGTFGAAFDKLASAANQWSFWGLLLLLMVALGLARLLASAMERRFKRPGVGKLVAAGMILLGGAMIALFADLVS
ncbi:MAG: hypothetical protein EOP84_00365 [Verrucomicrobiaceae bacterium]|nr:MAG: hypothetical protein EOP84_00365 [Verrucomicrobiaceae bacterium]